MTTPMSLQPWSWQIFILIQLWWQFFQMLVYGDIVYTQTWYWPWKLTVSSHLHIYASTANVVVIRPSSPSDSFVKIWATCEIFLGKWFTAPPPNPAWEKNFPYAYDCACSWRDYPQSCWPLAGVIEVMPGSNGFVQRVKVKTKTTVLERPVAKCMLLEATEQNEH